MREEQEGKAEECGKAGAVMETGEGGSEDGNRLRSSEPYSPMGRVRPRETETTEREYESERRALERGPYVTSVQRYLLSKRVSVSRVVARTLRDCLTQRERRKERERVSS